MTAPTRVFITGALGFIGRTLTERYRSLGVETRGVDVVGDPELDVVAGDVSAPGDWQRHAEGSDIVIHTAALVSMRSGLDEFWRVNTLGTRLALDAATSAGASRFVHFSSVTVFGFEFPDGVGESYPVRLAGVPYVDTKIASEQVVLQAQAAGEIPCTIVRPGDVYGPGSKPWTILPVAELKRRQFVLPAGGKAIFSPAFVDNLVDGVVAAASSPATIGRVLTLSDGVGVTTGDFFGRYAKMLGRNGVPTAPTKVAARLAGAVELYGKARRHQTEVNPSAVAYLCRTGTYSIASARELIGYEPKVGLDEGMRRTESWLRERGLVP